MKRGLGKGEREPRPSGLDRTVARVHLSANLRGPESWTKKTREEEQTKHEQANHRY
jgi:hypothetical protein